MKKYLGFILILMVYSIGHSQIITWTPPFATHLDSITVIFDATQGNRGLMGYTGDVYAHTGVITNLSSGPSDWKYVKTSWGQNTAETKLTRIGTNLYEFKIRGSVRSFYNVPQSETILKVAFVFRSATSPFLEGKTAEGGDIFLPLSTPGLNVTFSAPSDFPQIKVVNDTVKITVLAQNSTNLALYLDNSLLTQTASGSLSYNLILNSTGKKWVKAVATGSGGDTKRDSFYVVVRGSVTVQERPAGIIDGINYSSANLTKVTLSLYAPEKDYVFVIGDFTNWEVDPNYYMKRTPDGKRFWIEISNVFPGTKYGFQYLVDGKLKIADPYSEEILDPWNDKYISPTTFPNIKPYPTDKTTHIVSVIQTGQSPYQWQVTNFQRPAPEKLVIYELLIRDFLTAHDYKTLIDTIGYLKKLGINAIELMPVMEFDGNLSWGYNPAFKFAADKYYGPKEDLKRFIDVCHQNGIAVILDVVLNHHFGNSSLVRLYWDAVNNRPAVNNPWFNPVARHPYNVGYDFNHESPATKEYVDRFNKFWLTEFKVDGFRYDLSKGFTQTNSGNDVGLWGQYDQSRINILKRMMDSVRVYDQSAYLILEHFADNSEETVLSNMGFLIWGKMNYNYNEATMGWTSNSNLSYGIYKTRGWTKPNLITYMESHDEERLMYKNLQYGNSSGSYNVKDLATSLERMKLAGGFFFPIPGPKMIWQFGELGYEYSINYPCNTDACRTDSKPIRWDYFSVPSRRGLYKTWSALINLKTSYPAFNTTTFQYDDFGDMKKLVLNHSSMDVFILGNFGVTDRSINPDFSRTGYWYDFLAGDSINVINPNQSMNFEPGKLKVYTSVRLPKPDTSSVVTSIKSSADKMPEKFNLLQNFPNPFNPVTKISFDIPKRDFVSLIIYNVLGSKVAELINETMEPGSYTFEVDLNIFNLSSGVYLYQLKSGNYLSTKKMIYLK